LCPIVILLWAGLVINSTVKVFDGWELGLVEFVGSSHISVYTFGKNQFIVSQILYRMGQFVASTQQKQRHELIEAGGKKLERVDETQISYLKRQILFAVLRTHANVTIRHVRVVNVHLLLVLLTVWGPVLICLYVGACGVLFLKCFMTKCASYDLRLCKNDGKKNVFLVFFAVCRDLFKFGSLVLSMSLRDLTLSIWHFECEIAVVTGWK